MDYTPRMDELQEALNRYLAVAYPDLKIFPVSDDKLNIFTRNYDYNKRQDLVNILQEEFGIVGCSTAPYSISFQVSEQTDMDAILEKINHKTHLTQNEVRPSQLEAVEQAIAEMQKTLMDLGCADDSVLGEHAVREILKLTANLARQPMPHTQAELKELAYGGQVEYSGPRMTTSK